MEQKDDEDGNNDLNDDANNNNDEPLAVLYFHIFNLLKNLSVKIKEGDTSNLYEIKHKIVLYLN